MRTWLSNIFFQVLFEISSNSLLNINIIFWERNLVWKQISPYSKCSTKNSYFSPHKHIYSCKWYAFGKMCMYKRKRKILIFFSYSRAVISRGSLKLTRKLKKIFRRRENQIEITDNSIKNQIKPYSPTENISEIIKSTKQIKIKYNFITNLCNYLVFNFFSSKLLILHFFHPRWKFGFSLRDRSLYEYMRRRIMRVCVF